MISVSDFAQNENWLGEPSTLYVEFDRQQVRFMTDQADIHGQVASNFSRMLVTRPTQLVGAVTLRGLADGFQLEDETDRFFSELNRTALHAFVNEAIRVQFMRARPDLLWLHAAAVERRGAAVLIVGASGQGKSTLSTLLCKKGWQLMSDDVAPLLMTENKVLPYCPTPRRRIYPGNAIDPAMVDSLAKESVILDFNAVSRNEACITSIVFIEFRHGAPSTVLPHDASSTAFDLLRNAVNFFDHKGDAVARAVSLARGVTAYKLTYGSGEEAAELLHACL
jgi:hypothetical protein